MNDEETKPKRGRPSDFTWPVALLICDRMAGGESLRSICKEEGLPAESTVRMWAVKDVEGFHAHYTRAREAQMDSMAEDILEMSDEKTADVQRSRLQVDTRKWLMSKIAPKRFGDRMAIGGAEDMPPVRFNVSNMTDEQLVVLEAALRHIATTASGNADGGEGGDCEEEG